MYSLFNSKLFDHRDEVVLMLIALVIPLVTLPSMIF
jgi:hypothetical protein